MSLEWLSEITPDVQRDATIPSMRPVTIECIGHDAAASDVRGLARLLVDAVDSGAGVSFLAGLSEDEAEAWWRSILASSTERAIILIARDAEAWHSIRTAGR